MTKAFVHGNPETSAIWGPLIGALESRGVDDQMVLLSPPGFGAPAPEGWDASPQSYGSWLAGELEGLGGGVDLVGHDWGAGHVFRVVADRPDLIRSWAADCIGLLHPDYEWHDMAQTWQTPGDGEAAIEMMLALSVEERAAAYGGLGLPPAIAESMASGFTPTMGRCILDLYRAATQPAMAQLGEALAATELPPGLAIDATGDDYVASGLVPAVVERLGATHVRLEGLHHWWMVQDPDQAADALVAHWTSVAD